MPKPVSWSDLIIRSNSACTGIFTTNNTLNFAPVFQALVIGYNRSYHRSIKMAPNQVTEANSAKVYANLYGDKKKKKNLS